MARKFTTRPELTGSFGMVSSTHWLASAAGMGMLERGGNAFDAAVAAGFVLQVVEPHLNGPGGEVVMLIHEAATGATSVVCGQGSSPAGATVETYRDHGFVTIPGLGLWAACVPGAFDAWMELLATRGTMSLREVLAPAIRYAREGYPLVSRISGSINASRDRFLTEWLASAEVYLPRGRVPKPGARFVNEPLANTYSRLLEESESRVPTREAQIETARDIFYRGYIARTISDFVASAPGGSGDRPEAHALLNADDIAGHRTRVESSKTYTYKNRVVHKAGPWSQGPVFLQQLALLEGFDLSSNDVGSADYIHTVIESTKLAMADRDAWYGDPDQVPDRVPGLLSAAYNGRRRALIDDTASRELRPGKPDSAEPRILEAPGDEVASAGMGEPTLVDYQPPDGDTCHVDVVDCKGNMVSATPSGGWLQGSPVIPGLGFGLGTRLQMMWLDDQHPGGLRPATRPRTTLSPTLVTREGVGEFAFGTPGGDTQDQWTLFFFLSLVEFGMNMQEAIDDVMFQTGHLVRSFAPRRADLGSLRIEARVAEGVVAALQDRGHRVDVDGEWSLGRITGVSVDTKTGFLKAAANPRGMQGYAVGR